MELIQLQNVTKQFGATTVLESVNLTIEEGDIYGIIGISGSGKTTLLNLLTGFLEPTEGVALFHSHITQGFVDLNRNIHKIKRHIGFTPQHNSFYHKLTVEENLLHFGKLYGIKQDTLLGNIKSLLDFTKLAEHRHKLGEELSGGMQKRLDLSCSLVHKPRILVLDEPTSDLDPILQQEIMNLLREVNQQGVTIVIASHHLDSIENLCNKVAIVHKGRIHRAGALEDVRKPYLKEQFTIKLRPGGNKEQIISHLQRIPLKKIVDQGSQLVLYPIDPEKTLNSLLSIIKEENLYLHDLDLRKPSLHEVFQKIASN